VSGACAIGLDLGTSGVRAAVLDATGRRLAAAAVTLPAPLQVPDGGVEQQPETWWEAAVSVLRQIAAAAAGCDAAALCVDGTSATLLLCEMDGRPLGPALMYNDSRAQDEAAWVQAQAPPASAARGATSSLAKLLHLRQRYTPNRPVLALHQADWIIGRLLGHFGDSDWNNALKLGFDASALCWPDWMQGLDLAPVSLPRVHAPGTRLGPIDTDVAALTGLPRQVRVCAGTTDSTAAVVAAGALQPGDAVTSLGSTLVLKIVAESPVTAPQFGVYSQRLGDYWLVGGASNSGGAVLRQFFSNARIDALMPRIDPDSESGLDYYPLPAAGERFPLADPLLLPRMTPRPSDDARFLHGLLEGIARIERDGYRRLAELGAPPPRWVLSLGGGARNERWSALRARLLGIPVLPAPRQDAADGAAVLALRALTGAVPSGPSAGATGGQLVE
jgi:sugar (pentulose or hexulose) kinase